MALLRGTFNTKIRGGDHIRTLVDGLPKCYVESTALLMLAHIFIDDSGSGGDTGLMLLSGLVSTPDRWAQLSDDWQNELKVHPAVAAWHMSHANGLRGDFGGWSRKQVGARLGRLINLILRDVICAFTVAIEPKHYESIVKGNIDFVGWNQKAIDQPYLLLVAHALTGIYKLRDRYGLSRADVVFDFHQQHTPAMREMFEDFCSNFLEEEGAGDFLGRLEIPQERNKRLYLPLQAADIYAWYQHRRATAWDGIHKKAYRRLRRGLPLYNFKLDPEYLVRWVQTSHLPGVIVRKSS